MEGFCHARVLSLVGRNGIFQQLQDALELSVGGAVWVWQGAIFRVLLLKLLTLVDQQGGITAVVHKQVATICARHSHHLLSAPPVLWKSLTLPCEYRSCARLGD